jgi:membrane-bound lytic murein transglycosylase F
MRVTDSTQYDSEFESAGKAFLPWLDWRWLKAQAWQESRHDPKARSPVGALGISQFMPLTWDIDVMGSKELWLPRDAEPTQPEHAIRAQAWYDAKLWRQWSSKRSTEDRRRLMFASYNAGFGNLLTAQRLARGQVEYAPIIDELRRVTGGPNSLETRTYVERIEQWYRELTE